MSILNQNTVGIGKSVPSTLEISLYIPRFGGARIQCPAHARCWSEAFQTCGVGHPLTRDDMEAQTRRFWKKRRGLSAFSPWPQIWPVLLVGYINNSGFPSWNRDRDVLLSFSCIYRSYPEPNVRHSSPANDAEDEEKKTENVGAWSILDWTLWKGHDLHLLLLPTHLSLTCPHAPNKLWLFDPTPLGSLNIHQELTAVQIKYQPDMSFPCSAVTYDVTPLALTLISRM